MPAPSSSEELLELVRKSGVVDEKRLDTYLQQLRASGGVPAEPGKLAGLMVRDGLLTHFQAEQFLLGKWRRFTIGKYKVLERLGSGGMGSVYLCEHKFMRRRVAVKVLPAAKAEDPSSLERFYREARAAAALDHPNIVRAYDIDQDDNLHFLVMEYVDGSSLQDIVKKFGPMDPLRAAHYVRQSAIGLQHAHEAGLVHRDIKPGNLLVDRGGTVKILDMGLARFFHDEEDMLTKKYDESVLGTADYLAPEQAIDSHGVDIRADIYSLGATFYYILTGQPPFSEGTVAQKLIWHQTRQPKPITSYRHDIPEELLAVIHKLMAKEIKDRYQVPAEVTDALAPFTQVPIAPPPENEMPRLSPAAMGSSPGEPSQTQPPAPPSSGAPTVRREAARGPASPRPTPNPTSARPERTTKTSPPVLEPSRAPTTPSPAFAANNGSMMPEAATRGPTVAEDAPAWEQLAAVDTDKSAAKSDTEPTAPTPLSGRKKAASSSGVLTPKERKRNLIVVSSVAGVLVAGVILTIILMGRSSVIPQTGTPPPQASALLVVNKRNPAGGTSFRSIGEALEKARPGDVISVEESLIEDQVSLNTTGKHVTIRSGLPGGAKVNWRPPPGLDPRKLIDLVGAEGLRLEGFILDGQDRVDELVVLSKDCPGLTLDNIQLQGFKNCAVRMSNCWGDKQRPVKLERLVVMPPAKELDAALIIDANTKIQPAITRNVTISGCRISGPFKAILRIEGETDEIELYQNRFANAADAIVYNSTNLLPSPKLNLTLDSNTFFGLRQNALFFKTHPLPLRPPVAVNVKNNLFVQVATIANVEKFDKSVPMVIYSPPSNGNVRDGGKEGNISLATKLLTVPTPLLETKDPTKDKQFLVYPANSPLRKEGIVSEGVGYPGIP